MSKRRSSSRHSRIAFGSVLVLAACSSGAPVTHAPPASIVGTAPLFSAPPAPRAVRTGPVPVTIVTRDAAGHRHTGIGLRIRDLATRTMQTAITGTKGEVALMLEPGRYRVEAPVGCGPHAEVFKGDGGTLGVATSGQPLRLNLTVDARRRFWPGTPVTWQPEAPWPVGATVTYRFSMFDRCRNVLVPNFSFEDLVYQPVNLKMVSIEPRRSDATSYATVRFSCIAAGDASLVLVDPDVPTEAIDLFTLKPPFDASDPWCR